MIHKLDLHGFKSFDKVTLEFGDLTVLTGLNSSGKSSVIQAIRMFNEGSILLEGYGGLQEIKSRLSDSMKMNLFLDDGINLSFDGANFKQKKHYFPHFTYIGANRLGAEPTIPIYSDKYDIGSKGENTIFCLNYYANHELDERLKPIMAEGVTLDYIVKGWLKSISPGVRFEYEVKSNIDISYGLYNGNRATNVGFGLSYTLPVIVSLLVGTIRKNSIVVIENPEAHLHPQGQTEIGKLIALCSDCGVQVIIETHSDHLFDGIRLYTKNNKGFSDKLKAYWFEQKHENESTSVVSIKIDENGRYVEDCPSGFFDQFEINASALLF